MKPLVLVAIGLGTVLLLAAASPAGAQTNDEVNAGIQLNFSLPGARSLALGGAFVALADDATAAFANPAGLAVLTRPEVSLEGRSTDYTSEFVSAGRRFGAPTGTGVDTLDRLVIDESSESVTNLSFASFVYPRNRWAVGLFRHELANFRAAFRTQGAFSERPDGIRTRFLPVSAEMDLKIATVGLAAGFRVSESLLLGAGVYFHDFSLDSTTRRFDLFSDLGGFNEPPDYSPGNVLFFHSQVGDDDDVTFGAGFLWRSGKWSVGGAYRQGPELDFRAAAILGPVFGDDEGFVFADQQAKLAVPHVYAIGLAFRPTEVTTISFEYDRVTYSRLSSDMVYVFSEDPTPEQAAATRQLQARDVGEVRLGFEYVVGVDRNVPVALRVGAWHDPAHRIHFRGPTDDNPSQRTEATLWALEGDDEVHFTAGVGLLFRTFQLDVAFDLSDLSDVFSLSGVWRF